MAILQQWRRILKFAISGIGSTSVHVLVATVSIEFFEIHPGAANGLAFLVAVNFSYLANSYWTFGASLSAQRAGRFYLGSVVGLLFSVLISSLIAHLGYHYFYGIAGVVLVVPISTYFIHSQWTYR
ncbi:MAG: putative flippase GtrA [Cryomorphaceae bacterium]|jgi:putative flippase GtrA